MAAVNFLEGGWTLGEFPRVEYDAICRFDGDDSKDEELVGSSRGGAEEAKEEEPQESEALQGDAGADGDDEAEDEVEEDPEESGSEEEEEDGEDDDDCQQPSQVRSAALAHKPHLPFCWPGRSRCSWTAVAATGATSSPGTLWTWMLRTTRGTSAPATSRRPCRTPKATTTTHGAEVHMCLCKNSSTNYTITCNDAVRSLPCCSQGYDRTASLQLVVYGGCNGAGSLLDVDGDNQIPPTVPDCEGKNGDVCG